MNNIEKLIMCTQKIIPLTYDKSLSYYEMLCKVLEKINELIENDEEMKKLTLEQIEKLKQYKEEMDEIAQTLDDIKNGKYIHMYLKALKQWVDDNLIKMVEDIVKYIFFMLDDSGRLKVVIPNSWDFIEFDTDYNEQSPTWNHLILRY